MGIINKIKNFVHNPNDSVLNLIERLAPLLSDRVYLRLKFYFRMHEHLHLRHPKTYNEKLQWLKLYGRRPIDHVLSDKYLVKQYVSEKIGEEFVIPLLGVWNSPDEIDFNNLPNKFVLKCNHNSGKGMYICRDKNQLDVEKVKKGLLEGLAQDYFIHSREKAYKGIPPRIIAEEFMEDSHTKDLRDYKFFCFDGEPKVLFVATGREKGEHEVKFDFFDMEYNHLPITNGHPNASPFPEKPVSFDQMIHYARVLSNGMPHVRIDFYEVDGRLYFGEFTFSHWGGMMPFVPKKWDCIFGDWITLPFERK